MKKKRENKPEEYLHPAIVIAILIGYTVGLVILGWIGLMILLLGVGSL